MARRQSLMNAIARARNCKIAAGAGESSAGRSGVTRFVLADGSVQEAMITGELKRADIPAANLVSIEIGTNVTSIGSSAFSGCRSLTGVAIPDSVTSVGENAFRGCLGLTGVAIPDSVTSIGNQAFYNCSGLTGVAIPDSVTSVGEGAFSGCSGLNSVTFDGTTVPIG